MLSVNHLGTVPQETSRMKVVRIIVASRRVQPRIPAPGILSADNAVRGVLLNGVATWENTLSELKKPDRADHNDENYSQYYCVFCDVLTFIVRLQLYAHGSHPACCRHNSAVVNPASPCFRIPMICSSLCRVPFINSNRQADCCQQQCFLQDEAYYIDTACSEREPQSDFADAL